MTLAAITWGWVATFTAGILVGAPLGAILDNWLGIYLKRPRLVVTGGGGSGAPMHIKRVTVTNEGAFFGIRPRQTIVLGRRVHGSFQKGLQFDRHPAKRCTATLFEKATGDHVAQLWWEARGPDGEPSTRVTIESGESRSLVLFVRPDSSPTTYFVWAPEITDLTPKFDGTQEFVVRVYVGGREELSLDTSVKLGFDGRLTYQAAGGGGHF